jgi:hypothetical protein
MTIKVGETYRGTLGRNIRWFYVLRIRIRTDGCSSIRFSIIRAPKPVMPMWWYRIFGFKAERTGLMFVENLDDAERQIKAEAEAKAAWRDVDHVEVQYT